MLKKLQPIRDLSQLVVKGGETNGVRSFAHTQSASKQCQTRINYFKGCHGSNETSKMSFQIPVYSSLMHRVTLLRNLKKIQSHRSGLSSSWLHHAKFKWLSTAMSQDNFSTDTGSSDIKTTTWSSASHFSRLSTQELALGYKPPIAERPFLPGSSFGGFPEFLPGPKEGSLFPTAYKVNNPEQFDIKAWSHVCRELVDAELISYGAILIR